ncbi:MAG TPA: hypothetical protein VLA12_19610 [Planctomycetaceae bacterium]|nr:hypothetical protein [Planctomycetaceae bacterium]
MSRISGDKKLHHPDSNPVYYVDFTEDLEVSGRLLSGTPTITDATSALTLTNKAVGSADVTLTDGTTLTANKYVTYQATGGTAGTTYTVKILVSTTQSGETLVRNDLLQCETS